MPEPRPSQPPPLPIVQPSIRIADMGMRFLAFAMDAILVGALGVFLLIKILLPRSHYETMHDFADEIISFQQATQEAIEAGEPSPPYPDFSEREDYLEMFGYGQQVMLLLFFCYFGILEALLGGATLGKRTFGLQTALIGTPHPPSALQSILRGAIKSFALIAFPPFAWIMLFCALFVPGKRAVHDILCRTIMISAPLSEKNLN